MLGCTHYPFLRPVIEEVVGPDIEVIDPAAAVARQVERVLAPRDQAERGGNAPRAAGPLSALPSDLFYTTGDPARFATALEHLLGWRSTVQVAAWNAAGQLHSDSM